MLINPKKIEPLGSIFKFSEVDETSSHDTYVDIGAFYKTKI